MILKDTSKFQPYTPSKRAVKDPTILEEDRFNRKLSNLKRKNCISNEQFKHIKASGSQPARLYGLPKVHKNQSDPPYRPILNMINSYPSNLAKWLDTILKNLIPPQNSVKDTFQFVNNLKRFAFDHTYFFMCSYDVRSLFPSIPVDRTIDYILSTIDENQLPANKSTLKELLLLACKNVMFFHCTIRHRFYVISFVNFLHKKPFDDYDFQ